MTAGSIIAFWVVALLLIVVPGADWAFTIGAGLRGRSVLPAVAGLVIGYAVVTLVVAAGVGALVARTPALLTGLTLIGGLYLIWHGATTFRHPSTPVTASDVALGPERNIVLQGIGVSGLNPKGLLIFVALLPQFTDPGPGWPVGGQIALLGVVFMLTCAAFYLALGAFARRVLHTRPVAARAVSRTSGAAMVLIGAIFLLDRLLT